MDDETTAGTPPTRPLALVTGASSGIGFELAAELARRGHDLVMVAEDVELEVAAVEIRQLGAQVEALRVDLREASGAERVDAAVDADGRPLAVAALNAGVGKGGPFLDNPLDDELSIIDLNITSTVRLAKLVLPGMVAARAGRVLFTSSIASEMPGPFQAVYNASKSFVQSFAEGLQEELAPSGVTVTVLLPGPTDTEFFARGDLLDTTMGQGPKDDPATVARQGVDALLAGRKRVAGGGLKTRLQDAANRVLPDRVKAVMHRGMAVPRSHER